MNADGPGLDRLWAGWRSAYIEDLRDDEPPGDPDGRGSLFERLAQMPDDQVHIVARAERCFAIMNRYPYTSGHLLVLPNRAVPDLEQLSADEHTELFAMVRDAVVAVKAAFGCQGVNVGMNLGRASGAGVPDHLHVHIVPRWGGDTNFMTTVAEARVMPEPLDATWRKVRASWPSTTS